MANEKKKETAADRKATLEEALKHPGAVLQEDAIKASKERVTAHNDAMVAAGAIQGTTAAAPTGSVSVGGTPTSGAPVGGVAAPQGNAGNA